MGGAEPRRLRSRSAVMPTLESGRPTSIKGIANAMTVDVEDYFQVAAFDEHVSRDDWDDIPCRIERNIDRILALFDHYSVKATFFTLGWIAERYPEVVRRIVSEGHELASHGYEHSRVGKLRPNTFRHDVTRTRLILEDLVGVPVQGYRAPSFSINENTEWAYEELRAAGYVYSSSVFPIKHDHYGVPDAPRIPYSAPSGVLEIPMSTISMLGRNWPCSGGGYFRLLPLAWSIWATKRINLTERRPIIFYFHPWEIDPGQPSVGGISRTTRFRHYHNVDKFENRLKVMLQSFQWHRMDEIFLNNSQHEHNLI